MKRGGELVAALNGAEPLTNGNLERETARGVDPGGDLPGIHIPTPRPTVQLWDDFGATSPAAIGNTTVIITGVQAGH